MNNTTVQHVNTRIKDHDKQCVPGEWYMTGWKNNGKLFEMCTRCKRILSEVIDETPRQFAADRYDSHIRKLGIN